MQNVNKTRDTKRVFRVYKLMEGHTLAFGRKLDSTAETFWIRLIERFQQSAKRGKYLFSPLNISSDSKKTHLKWLQKKFLHFHC